MSGLNEFRAKIFKALADPIRLQILDLLQEGEKCVCEIVPALGVSQPLVSRHLKILKTRGLITDRKDGNRRIYSVTEPIIFNVIDTVKPKLRISLSEIVVDQIL
ncbi:MAG: metalloregulator ArsR/SmtB family transcription factor [Candidatus Bathyarchaeota archaeon]|jgi:ArsR family transcriptional regulator|nr:metalloregulator ArsR/SmtB family transcription factor [Candidatus Bathyarchaeota archaeon]